MKYQPENDTEYQSLPERYRAGMKRYIEEHILPGHFLIGMLEGSLYHIMAHVDQDMVPELRNIYLWIYNEAPSKCWGSSERVKAWIEKRNDKEEV